MSKNNVKVRLMEAEDFDAIVQIDERVLGSSRIDYYRLKFEKLVQSKDHVPSSLVAEAEGKVVGFVMGELYIGEFGLSREATLDTIGVDPTYQNKGIGRLLIQEYMDHVKTLGIQKVNTLVDEKDSELVSFFKVNKFAPSKILSLVRSL
jgi:predicted N-acetyltransferase YhbS